MSEICGYDEEGRRTVTADDLGRLKGRFLMKVVSGKRDAVIRVGDFRRDGSVLFACGVLVGMDGNFRTDGEMRIGEWLMSEGGLLCPNDRIYSVDDGIVSCLGYEARNFFDDVVKVMRGKMGFDEEW